VPKPSRIFAQLELPLTDVVLMQKCGRKVAHAPAAVLQRIANEPSQRAQEVIPVVSMNVPPTSVHIYRLYQIKNVAKRLLTYVWLVAPEWDVLTTFSTMQRPYQPSVPDAVILFRVSSITRLNVFLFLI
jgi:hypothetical protein